MLVSKLFFVFLRYSMNKVYMDIKELQRIYAAHPNVKGWAELMKKKEVKTIFWSGLHASATSLFTSVLVLREKRSFVFVLDDMESAGYFYHDLMQGGGGEGSVFSFFVPQGGEVRTEGCGQ